MVLVVALAAAGPARAADPPRDPDVQRALEHNKQARKLFNLGLFKEAAAEYRKAYAAKASPDFLYNLAQCHKRLDTTDDLRKAAHYLESYINSAPFSPIRDAAEKELRQVRDTIKKREAEKKERAGVPFYKKWWFWTGVGVLVAGATTAAVVVAVQPDDPVEGTADPGILKLPLGLP